MTESKCVCSEFEVFFEDLKKIGRIYRIGLTYESPGCRPTLEQGATLFGSAAMRPPGIWHVLRKWHTSMWHTEAIAITEQQRISKESTWHKGSLHFLVLLE